jgi:hypothetical protein
MECPARLSFPKLWLVTLIPMKPFLQAALLVTALCLTGCAPHEVNGQGQSFWAAHGVLMLFGWLCFPRITFWIFSAMTGGFFFWLGVLLIPHIMVAFWATTFYWHTNPLLCAIAWFVAFWGEGGEKSAAWRKRRRKARREAERQALTGVIDV